MLLSILTITGCKPVINAIAFHPDTKNVIPVDKLPQNVQEVFINTTDNIKIQSYFIPNKTSEKLIIYFHGNAGNIGHRLYDLKQLNSFSYNVLGVGYRGYGKSQGKPSEAGIYIDGKSALKYATDSLGFKLNNIYVFGRSIGTTVAINTSQNITLKGLILVSPLTSGKAQARTTGLRPFASLAGNSFNNINKIKNITCPLLVIHGTQDNIIPFSMGKSIFDEAESKKELITISGGNHNNLSTKYAKEYWAAVYNFLKH